MLVSEQRQEVMKQLVILAENFSAEISTPRLKMILSELENFPSEQITAGLTKILRTRKYPGFPALAEILEAVGGSQRDELTLEAEGQWKRLWIAADKGAWTRYFGEPDHPGPEFYLNPTAQLTLRQMGGRSAMLTWREAELNWRHREWVETYRLLAGNEQKLVEAGAFKREVLPEKVRALLNGIGDGGVGAGKGSLGQQPKLSGAA
ncbi:MAG: hypothetical protein KKE29_12875 [Proteobacteria bacterium]|nr:hypothetical protein [Pseudomonadota bacterium]MBU4599073.1 hypothetical protein [Pseudomonadota bacterium]MBV1714874.1 hypothetical protein [Desulfarculus sp.]